LPADLSESMETFYKKTNFKTELMAGVDQRQYADSSLPWLLLIFPGGPQAKAWAAYFF